MIPTTLYLPLQEEGVHTAPDTYAFMLSLFVELPFLPPVGLCLMPIDESDLEVVVQEVNAYNLSSGILVVMLAPLVVADPGYFRERFLAKWAVAESVDEVL